jgi:hypothetical protein
MGTIKSTTISLLPEQFETAKRLAKKESRTVSEVVWDALRRYEIERKYRKPSAVALKNFGKAVDLFREDARRTGLNKMTMREINAEVAAARKDVRKARPTTKRPLK